MLLLMPVFCTFAQEPTFSTRVSNTTVSTGEPFRVEFSVENASQVSDFQAPAFNGLEVLSRSQGQTTRIINGKVSQSVSFVYTVQAPSPGRFTIAGAAARVDGVKLRSNPVTITVEKGAAGAAPSAGNPPPASSPFSVPTPAAPRDNDATPGILRKGEDAMAKIKKNVFVRVEVDHQQVYVGQQVTATYKLYTRLPTSSQVTKVPAFTGFSTHDVKLPNPPQATMERVNGQPFKVFTIRKTMLFPLQPGELALDPVEVDNKVRLYQVQRRARSSDPFADIFDDPFFKDPFGGDPFSDPFFQDAFGGADVSYHDYDYHITSTPVPIHVKPLPDKDKPADFSGAVGQFSIKASLDKNSLSTDDAATLTVTVSGKGNITLLSAPKPAFPGDIESYEPKISDHVGNSSPLGGSRSFEYVLMPRAAGHFTIPPVTYAYFDPASQRYETLKTQAFELDVTPGKNQPSRGVDFTAGGQQLQPIRKGTLAWSKPGILWFGTWWPWLAMGLPLLLLVLLLAVRRRRAALESDQARLRHRKANKVALRRLSQARKYLQQRDSKAFYGEVSQAVWGYLCDKLGIPFAELTRKRAEDSLRAQQLNGQLPERLFGLLDHCEVALYAGGGGQAQMTETYNDALKVISELDEKLKKGAG